jgi:hypothetical protein
VLIINFLGVVFHVQPLMWQEWLATVAIGAGAMLWSFLVRLLSRTVFARDSSSSSEATGCWAWVTRRLSRMNQVKSRHLTAAAAVYSSANRLVGVGSDAPAMSVHDAVALARDKAANRQREDAEAEEEAASRKGSRIKAWLGRRGTAGSREERTISGRSDSACSLGKDVEIVRSKR